MESEAATTPPRSRQRLQRLTLELQRDWEITLRAFLEYRDLPPHKKYRALGKLFERICLWIERGAQSTVLNQFVLLPTEQVLSRMFARTTQKEALPNSFLLYLYWIESSIMRGLATPNERFIVVKQTPGEPSVVLCEKFNQMNFLDRSVLYLYVVEKCTPTEVSDNTGIPFPQVIESLPALWEHVAADEPKSQIPAGWQLPRRDEEGQLILMRPVE